MNKSATNFVELSTAGSINLHLPQILPMRRFSAPAGARYGKPAGIHIASAKKNLTDKTKASRTLLHIRLAFSRSLKAVVPKHVASSCFGTVRFKLCNKTKQCRRIKPFRVSLSRVISQTNFTEIQRVTVSRTRASTQDRLLSVRSLVFLPPPNYREKP